MFLLKFTDYYCIINKNKGIFQSGGAIMREKLIPILKVSIAFFVVLYTIFIYQVTQSISLVTLFILLAGLAPVLHMAWTYLQIKFDEYQDVRYMHYMKR